jgi:hypothetical protein
LTNPRIAVDVFAIVQTLDGPALEFAGCMVFDEKRDTNATRGPEANEHRRFVLQKARFLRDFEVKKSSNAILIAQ